jgi:phenylacetate-CoA ligase
MSSELWNPSIESMPIKKLKDLQLKQLKTMIKYVDKNNKYYHQKLKDAKVKPQDIKSLEDIKKLPFLTKQDLIS